MAVPFIPIPPHGVEPMPHVEAPAQDHMPVVMVEHGVTGGPHSDDSEFLAGAAIIVGVFTAAFLIYLLVSKILDR